MSETPKPWEFPVGSVESRASARIFNQRKNEERVRIEFVSNVARPHHDNTKPHATPWADTIDGKLFRILYVPNGMRVEEARRIVGA